MIYDTRLSLASQREGQWMEGPGIRWVDEPKDDRAHSHIRREAKRAAISVLDRGTQLLMVVRINSSGSPL